MTDQLARRVSGDPLTFLAGSKSIRPSSGQFLVDDVHRRDGVFGPYWGAAVRSFRLCLAVAAGADRRHLRCPPLGSPSSCGDDRGRLQPDQIGKIISARASSTIWNRAPRSASSRDYNWWLLLFAVVTVVVLRSCRTGALVFREDRHQGQRARDQLVFLFLLGVGGLAVIAQERGGAAGLSDRHGAGADLCPISRAAQRIAPSPLPA